MNKARRKQIQAIISQAETIRDQIEQLKAEEEEAFENLPESIQYTEKGERMEEAMSQLEYAFDHAEEIISYLEEAVL